MRHMRIVFHVFIGLLLFTATVFASINICPKCGWENDDVRQICIHCEGQLIPSESASDDRTDDNAAVSSGQEYIDADIAGKDISAGEEHLRKGDIVLARLFFRNATALNMLTDPHESEDRSDRIARLLAQCTQTAGTVSRKCSLCNGTGMGTIKTEMLDNKIRYRSAHGKSCSRCGGKGFEMIQATINEMKYLRGQALKRYEALRQAMRFVRVGEAWVPQGLYGDLGVKQIALLKRSVARPCPECMGMCRVNCDKCKGAGATPCSNRKCNAGMVEEEVRNRLKNTSVMTRKVKCPVCNGAGEIRCVECNGAGSLACRKCGGTGDRSICGKCGGHGVAACARCGGSGVYKRGACSKCGGEGESLCSSCMGDGRK